MSERDKFDELAEQLVHHCRYCDRLPDGYKCAADHADCIRDVAAELRKLAGEGDTYKRIAERNHKANMMPCPKCGYQPQEIKAHAALED